MPEHLPHHVAYFVKARDVTGNCYRVLSPTGKLRGLVGAGEVDISDTDLRAFAREPQADGTADAAPASRHDGDLPFEPHRIHLQCCHWRRF